MPVAQAARVARDDIAATNRDTRTANGHASNGQDTRDPPREGDIDTMEITGEDAAFILGSGGKTKTKLAHVSGAGLSIVEKSGKVVLEITGAPEVRARAKKYVQFVMVQRVRPVHLDPKDHPDDLTIVNIPYDAVSFVTGKAGRFLRMVEEEFGTLLFFLQSSGQPAKGHRDANATMQLAIFGDVRPRRGSELKIMTATEMKFPGHFTKTVTDFCSEKLGFDTDWLRISDEDYSYALGKGGSTRRKLSRASGCIVEYVGQVAYFAGTKAQRECAREYLGWVLQQRIGAVHVNYEQRPDCTSIMVPAPCIGYITGHRGVSLRQIEEETKTFCFFEGSVQEEVEHPKPLLIFGLADGRKYAETLVWEKIIQKSGRTGDWEPPEKGKGKGKGRKGKGGKKGGEDKDFCSVTTDTLIVDEGEQIGSISMKISSEDAAFVMGPQGRTKRKVAYSSGTNVEIRSVGGSDRLWIQGTEKRRAKAQMYIKLVMAQRLGPVHIDEKDCEDLTIVDVPGEAVSFVTGKQGSFLRLMEEEFGTLLFFLDFNMNQHQNGRIERLAILGPMRARRGTELKVMAAVEMKCPGHYTQDLKEVEDPSQGFGTDLVYIADEDYSYALGKQGSTRKNIVKQSGCLVEYVGYVAFLSGTRDERKKARDYLLWLFEQRRQSADEWQARQWEDGGEDSQKGKGKGKGKGKDAGKGKPADPIVPVEPADPEDDDWGDWGGDSEEEESGPPAQSGPGPIAYVTGPSKPGPNAAAPFVSREVELLDLPPQLLDEAAWPDLDMRAKPKKKR